MIRFSRLIRRRRYPRTARKNRPTAPSPAIRIAVIASARRRLDPGRHRSLGRIVSVITRSRWRSITPNIDSTRVSDR